MGAALISGDDISIVRYAAGTARLTEPALHGILDPPFGRSACGGRQIAWVAVRRRCNRAADQAATEGVKLPLELRPEADWSPL
eukprot:11169440-Lingulodinium_polyedra.AAC.1